MMSFLYNSLLETISYIIRHTDPNLICDENLDFFYLDRKKININNFRLTDILQNYQENIKESIKNDDNTLSEKIIQEMVLLSKNIFKFFENGNQIEIFDQQKSYGFLDLMKNNDLIKNTILGKNIQTENNINNILNTLKNNYLSQYFYFVKYKQSINNIEKLDFDKNFFKNTNQILCQISKNINLNNIDLTILQETPPQIYLYPEIFIQQINDIQHTLKKSR